MSQNKDQNKLFLEELERIRVMKAKVEKLLLEEAKSSQLTESESEEFLPEEAKSSQLTESESEEFLPEEAKSSQLTEPESEEFLLEEAKSPQMIEAKPEDSSLEEVKPLKITERNIEELTEEELEILKWTLWAEELGLELEDLLPLGPAYILEEWPIWDEEWPFLFPDTVELIREYSNRNSFLPKVLGLYRARKLLSLKKAKKLRKQFRYRGRSYRFMRVARSLRRTLKIWRHFFIFPTYKFLNICFPKLTKSRVNGLLVKKLTLTQRLIEDEYLEFFYKLNKIKRRDDDIEPTAVPLIYAIDLDEEDREEEQLYIYIRNYHQKPYWKLKLARDAHWRLFTRKKTLRKQRYKQFLEKYKKKYENFLDKFLYLLNYYLKVQFSWHKTNFLDTYIKYLFLANFQKNIFSLPLFFSKFINWKIYKKKNFKLLKRIGKWSYLRYRRFICPWLQRKRNFPKKLKNLAPKINFPLLMSQYDPLTGYIWWNNNFYNEFFNPFNEIKTNYFVKLHMYRYKPD